ncbi:WXG100 family type VII secretion target [Nocardia callitridis]|uniref:PPE family domain-containing protein n=1 Tax=Nocardia callitridis TaxID=648753 RepID=A0ABP9L289_9NOCA
MSGYEPPRIPGGGENSKSWDHHTIKNSFEPLNPTDAHAQADQYWKMHQLWDEGVETFARSIQASIAQAWSGPAAEASKKSIADYTTDAKNLSPALAELHTGVRDAANAITNTKSAIPGAVDTSWPTAGFSLGIHNAAKNEASEAEETARTAMTEHYVTPFGQVDGKIPVLPTPLQPTDKPDTPAPPVPGGTPGDSTTGPGGPSTPGETPETPTAPGDTDGDGQPDTPQEQSTQQASATTPSATPTLPTDPSATTPGTNTPGAPNTVAASTTSPNIPGGTKLGSPGGLTPGSPGAPQPGKSLPGVPTAPGTQGNPAAAAAAARGAAGPGMMGPGMGPGKGKSEENEHKAPEYLVTQENTDELIGEIPKTVPGGVIGGEPPA